MTINKEIFREYDIRGIAEKDFTAETLGELGRAIAFYYNEKGISKISIGCDARISSPFIKKELKKVFLEAGIDVIDIGMCTTPLLYFSQFHFNLNGGIMITGSHNPPEYNGMKVCLNKTTIYGDEIQKLHAISEKKPFLTGFGKESSADIRDVYINYVADNIKPGKTRKLKVVIDSGNGTGGLLAPRLYEKLGFEVTALFSEPDGSFPNHHPDPTVEKNMAALKEKVLSTNADLGIGFDGDADRIGVVDEKGNIIWGDQLMIVLAKSILKEKPGSTFIAEVKCSDTLFSEVKKAGGNIIMWKVGHSLIKSKMKEEHAELAGEMSGHIFFSNRYFGFDDAVYAGARLLEILSGSGLTLSEHLKEVPKAYASPEIRVDCPEKLKFELVNLLKAQFKGYNINDIDGIRVKFERGWALLRASNTQPVVVLRFEADSPEELSILRNRFETLVKDEIRKHL